MLNWFCGLGELDGGVDEEGTEEVEDPGERGDRRRAGGDEDSAEQQGDHDADGQHGYRAGTANRAGLCAGVVPAAPAPMTVGTEASQGRRVHWRGRVDVAPLS